MDRGKWGEVVTSFGWVCGRCGRGHLHISDNKKVDESTAETNKAAKEDWFDHEDAEYRFAALLICNNANCADPVAISGTMYYEHFQVGYDDYETYARYRVKAVTPPPFPFAMDKKIPEAVRDHLKMAAGLLWTDHDAAGNRIRQAVEALMDERGIKKTYIEASKTPGKSGKRKKHMLHARIDMYKAANGEAADHLMAIKWIGNAGSHTGSEGLTRDQILDAFDLMEHALEEIYIRHRATLAKKVAKIVSSKKPVKAPKPKPFKF